MDELDQVCAESCLRECLRPGCKCKPEDVAMSSTHPSTTLLPTACSNSLAIDPDNGQLLQKGHSSPETRLARWGGTQALSQHEGRLGV